MKKIIAALVTFAVMFMASLSFASPASATKAPTQDLKCDVITADYHRSLTNGDHINMTIKDSTGEYQVNAFVDRNIAGGYDTLGLRLPGGETKPLTKNEVDRGSVTFNYGDYVKASPYTVKFVQTNSTDTWPNLECGNPDDPADTDKKVPACHATGNGNYTYINPSINAFINAGHSGHEGDIYDTFTYTTKGGKSVTVPGKNIDKLYLLDANPKCVEPKTDEKIAKPEPTYTDVCGVKDDVDLAVADGRGYAVGNLIKDGNKQSITVTADNGFVFTDGSKSVTFTHTFSAETPEECDLPETGGAAEYNTTLGLLALAGVGVLGGAFLLTRRRRS